jgi:integrase
VGVISLAAAREEARRVLEQMALGRVPVTQARAEREAEREQIEKDRAANLAAKAHADNSFEKVARDYFVLKLRRDAKSHAAIEADIERIWIKAWGDRPITSIKKRDVTEVLASIADSGRRTMARCAFAHLRMVFNWALSRSRLGEIETSPCDRIKINDLCGDKVPRERVLDDGELRVVWQAADTVGHPWGDLTKMLLFTGLRCAKRPMRRTAKSILAPVRSPFQPSA